MSFRPVTAAFSISEQLLKYNRPGTALTPIGLILHDTATPEATAQNEHDYFNTADRGASAHYFVDWTTIIRTIPETEQAWHAFSYANAHFLSIELCDTSNVFKFEESYARYVWLAADICRRHNFNPDTDVHSHQWVSQHYQGDHTDPIGYLGSHGVTWDQVIADIKAQLAAVQAPINKVDELKIVAASALNVRSNPDTSATIRYVLKHGQEIHLSETQGDWSFTTYGALGGWVSNQYLQDLPKPTPAPKPAPAPEPTPTPAPAPAPAPAPSPLDNLMSGLEMALKAAQELKGGN